MMEFVKCIGIDQLNSKRTFAK